MVSVSRDRFTLYFEQHALKERGEDVGIDAGEKRSSIVLQILFLSRDLPLTLDKSNLARRAHFHCTAETVVLSSLLSDHVRYDNSLFNCNEVYDYSTRKGMSKQR